MSLTDSPSPSELAERTFAYAREAEADRDWPQALARWTLARKSFPDRPPGYIGAAVALRELGRLDEAEAVIGEAVARFPDDPGPRVGWAALAHGRGDWAAAAERWDSVRARFPQEVIGYSLGAAALRGLGRDRDAETVLGAGTAQCPGDAALALEHARIAHAAQDWPEAARRWQHLRACAPAEPAGYAGGAQALGADGRPDEADAVLTQAVERFPDQAALALEWARLGEHRDDAAEVLRRWELVRQRHPDQLAGQLGAVQALRQAERFEAAEAAATAALERFPEEPRLHFEHAVAAAGRRDWPEAAQRWASLRARFPEQPAGYVGGAIAAREQGQRAEAETLLADAMARFPNEIGPVLEYARTAHLAGDWTAAVERWAAVRQRDPNDPAGYVAGAMALGEIGQADQAEAVIAEALIRFPNDPEAAVQHAWLANRRGGWAAAVERWQALRQRFPDQVEGYCGAVQALRQLRRFDEAAAIVGEAMQRLPDRPELLIEHAWIAHDTRDWPEATRRWEMVREQLPDHVAAYAVAAEALAGAGRFDEAEALAGEGCQRFPANPLPYAAAAKIATARGDRREALLRWTTAQQRFPGEAEFSHRLLEARLLLAEDEAAAPSPERGDAAAGSDAAGHHDLMLSFESLGGSGHGCEFGLFQREMGAEPLGLLRWADLSHHLLAEALEAEFDGVGLPENTEIFIHEEETGDREYWSRDSRYWMAMRTFMSAGMSAGMSTGMSAGDLSEADIHDRTCRRLQFLRQKLIDDLRAGEKIFVYKVQERNLTKKEIARLHQALRRYGDNTLLYVRYADAAHPNGTVETAAPGLLIGSIDHFAFSPDEVLLGIDTGSWLRLCRNALTLRRRKPTRAKLGR